MAAERKGTCRKSGNSNDRVNLLKGSGYRAPWGFNQTSQNAGCVTCRFLGIINYLGKILGDNQK